MSAGSSTYFCSNGHIVYNSFPDEIFYDVPKQCPICMSSNILGIGGWGAYYYGENGIKIYETEMRVPDEPINHLYIDQVDDFGTVYKRKIDVYDVSLLFRKEKKL